MKIDGACLASGSRRNDLTKEVNQIVAACVCENSSRVICVFPSVRACGRDGNQLWTVFSSREIIILVFRPAPAPGSRASRV